MADCKHDIFSLEIATVAHIYFTSHIDGPMAWRCSPALGDVWVWEAFASWVERRFHCSTLPVGGASSCNGATHLLSLRPQYSYSRYGPLRTSTISRVTARHRAVPTKDFKLNKANHAATPAAPKPRDRGEVSERPDNNHITYSCLLTRAELKAIIAEQLG